MRPPLLLAHRGARRRAPENTFAAFALALADGCDGFEFDVRRTADGRGVICHGATFHRLRIARHCYGDLLHISDQLCCLEDVLRRYSGRAFLDIELKDEGLEPAVTVALRATPQRCVVSSFLPDVITSFSILAPELPLGLIADTQRKLDRWKDLPISNVMVHRRLLSAGLIRELHAAEKQVFVWTVNKQAEMLRFANWGVDGMISDDTELLSRTFPRP